MESIWKQTHRCEERSALDREIKVDTVIIGGGIAGILTAWQLEQCVFRDRQNFTS